MLQSSTNFSTSNRLWDGPFDAIIKNMLYTISYDFDFNFDRNKFKKTVDVISSINFNYVFL